MELEVKRGPCNEDAVPDEVPANGLWRAFA